MAEERISVIVYEKDPCENCPGNPMTDCQICERDLRYDGGMTRQEAIEKMAKAICKSWLKGGCNACKHKDKSCKEYVGKNMRIAEAALNALLSREE